MIQYQELFSFELQHDYYPDSEVIPITVQADKTTQTLIQQYNGFFKQAQNRGILLFPEDNNLQSIVAQAPDTIFQFELYAETNNVFMSTDLPLNQLGILHFDSTTAVDEKLSGTFQSTTDNAQQKIASIEIHSSSLESDTPNNNFTIHFQARAIAWKYYFITNNKTQTLGLQGEQASLFSGPTPTNLPNGEEALVFDSGDHKLLLQEQSDIRLSLVDTSNNNEILLETLPVATPNAFQRDAQKNYSAIYVYL